MLDFEPAQDVPTYLPTSLATRVIDQPWVNLFEVQRKVIRYCIVSRIYAMSETEVSKKSTKHVFMYNDQKSKQSVVNSAECMYQEKVQPKQ